MPHKLISNFNVILYSEGGTQGLVRDGESGKEGESVYILLCIPVVLAKAHRDITISFG